AENYPWTEAYQLLDSTASASAYSNQPHAISCLRAAARFAPRLEVTKMATRIRRGIDYRVKNKHLGKEDAKFLRAKVTEAVRASKPKGRMRSLLEMIQTPEERAAVSRYKKAGHYSEIAEDWYASYLTDQVHEAMRIGASIPILGRDPETMQVADTLVRLKGRTPILVGSAGVGKTTIIERLAQMIVTGQGLPDTVPYQTAFRDAVVIEAAGTQFADEDIDIMMFIKEVEDAEKMTGRPHIIFLNEIHALHPNNAEALKYALETRGIRLIGDSTSAELQSKFKYNPALLRRFQQIPVEEFTIDQATAIIEGYWRSRIEAAYTVKLEPGAVRTAVRLSAFVLPDNGRPDGAIKMLQDVAIAKHRASGGAPVEILKADLQEIFRKTTGLPADPENLAEMSAYAARLEEGLNRKVRGQRRAIHETVEAWLDLIAEDANTPKVLAFQGTTGTGKTFLGSELVKQGTTRPGAVLEINGNEFAGDGNGEFALSKLLGAGPGYVSSDQFSGILPEWLDDPSKGKFGGIIVINEAEKMPKAVWTALMEFFDRGELRGNDGKLRRATKHLVILTTNRGALRVFPPNIGMWSQAEIDRRASTMTQAKLKELFVTPEGPQDKSALPPEIVNRVHRYILFDPIARDQALEIGADVVDELKQEIQGRNGIQLVVSDEMREHLSIAGFTVSDGARQIRRQIETALRSAIRLAASQGELKRGDSLRVDLAFTPKGEAQAVLKTSGGWSGVSPVPQDPRGLRIPPQAWLERLARLFEEFRLRVFGQESVGQSLADSLVAQGAGGARQRALSVFVIGTTGTGKTETGKAIATVLYDSPDRASLIELGKVSTQYEMEEVFKQLEVILTQNPEGGVVVFDEASNMGGNSPAVKNALFKMLYTLTDEPRWTGPSGRVFENLPKFFFLFTGNDGERAFQGASADDLRMAIWEEMKARAKVRTILIEAGVPEAFVGRMADTILMKPLTRSEVESIVKRMLDAKVAEISKQYGIAIEADPALVSTVAEVFYSHDRGGRSVRSFVEDRLSAAVMTPIIRRGLIGKEGLVVRLSLRHNRPFEPFLPSPDYKFQALLSVEVDGRTFDADVTEFAPEVNLPPRENVLATAYHEAGHAVGNVEEETGSLLQHITVRGADEYLGYARYTEAKTAPKPTLDWVRFRMASLYAGTLAEQRAGFAQSAGWRSDLDKIRKLASSALLQWGLVPALTAVQVGAEGTYELSEKNQAIFDREMNKLVGEARALAERLLASRWARIERIAATLMERGHIDRAGYLEIVASVPVLEDCKAAVKPKKKR
ncbi:MAG TPA: AAA family ATPase, partial [Bdellovibrionota bacterium]|nr:AAA family ATPase [Bdellovibrionota bacterium]